MKRTLALLLTLLMVLSLVPAAFAAEEEFEIKDGDSLATWGAYPAGAHNILTEYNGPGGAVTVPDGVDAICYNAMGESYPVFGSDSGVTSIVIPASVKIIDNEAFRGCHTLKKVTFNGDLEELGLACFEDCTGLTDIAIPDGITELSVRTFAGCTSLEHVTLPAGLQSIHERTFENCTALRKSPMPGPGPSGAPTTPPSAPASTSPSPCTARTETIRTPVCPTLPGSPLIGTVSSPT